MWSRMDREQKETMKRAVGRRARRTRERQGLTVAEVARRASLPRQYVYDLEGGIRVSIVNVTGVALALGVSCDWLLGLHEARGQTHHCCMTAADRDALHRFTKPGLLRLADGTFTDDLGDVGASTSMIAMATGDPIELIECGRYRWRGQEYHVGEGEPTTLMEDVAAANDELKERT